MFSFLAYGRSNFSPYGSRQQLLFGIPCVCADSNKLERNHGNLLLFPKKFKVVLQKVLCENAFYSLDEYFELQKS